MTKECTDIKMKLAYDVTREFKKCKKCKHNPKNMTWKVRIKTIWEDLWSNIPTICGVCTAEMIIKRFKGIK